jgi:hypothetical protein
MDVVVVAVVVNRRYMMLKKGTDLYYVCVHQPTHKSVGSLNGQLKSKYGYSCVGLSSKISHSAFAGTVKKDFVQKFVDSSRRIPVHKLPWE